MNQWRGGLLLALVMSGSVAAPSTVLAQTAYEEVQAIVKAEVLEITAEKEETIMGTNAIAKVQTVNARLSDGDQAGKVVSFESDLLELHPGDRVYLTHVKDMDGLDVYVIKDVDRGFGLIFLFLLFAGLLLLFAGRHGIRALISLLLSIGGIVFLLLPALLHGYDPVLMSLLISGLILALALFGTHGFGPISTIGYFGTVGAVLLTSVLAWFFVGYLRLSGYGDDASVYLNFATNGQLDLSGLLLGSIIIGVLGVLDDIAITQASVVEELKRANAALSSPELYRRALKVGRDHVSSLVNTLALAYVGAALPLVLLFSTSQAPLYFTLNQEIIAAELARIMIGSIGLILTVPLTTAIAAWWFSKREIVDNPGHGHYHHHH